MTKKRQLFGLLGLTKTKIKFDLRQKKVTHYFISWKNVEPLIAGARLLVLGCEQCAGPAHAAVVRCPPK
jgi:hypothetical protein